jgi:hypothetical protein
MYYSSIKNNEIFFIFRITDGTCEENHVKKNGIYVERQMLNVLFHVQRKHYHISVKERFLLREPKGMGKTKSSGKSGGMYYLIKLY